MDLSLSDDYVKLLISESSKQPKSFFDDKKRTAELLDKISSELNDGEVPLKKKTGLLLILSNLSLFKNGRTMLLDCLKTLNNVIEMHLILKASSNSSFNISVGKLHELILVIIVRICDYRLKSQEMLEFVHEDLELALNLITSTVKVTSYEDSIMHNMMKLLCGLINPSNSFNNESFYNDFTNHANKMLNFSISTHLVDVIINSIHARWFSKPRKDTLDSTQQEIVIFFFNYVQSIYMYASEGTTHFRQHLLVATQLFPKLLSPYIKTCVEFSPALAGSNRAACFVSDPLLLGGLVLALKTLIMACFRMPRQRDALVKTNFSSNLLEAQRFFDIHPKVLALLIIVNINLNSLVEDEVTDLPEECNPLNIIKQLQNTILSLSSSNQNEIIDYVLYTSEGVPISRDLPSYTIVIGLFDSLKKLEYLTVPLVEEEAKVESKVNEEAIAVEPEVIKEESKSEIAIPMKRKTSSSLLGFLPWIPGGSGKSLRLPQEDIEEKKKYNNNKKKRRKINIQNNNLKKMNNRKNNSVDDEGEDRGDSKREEETTSSLTAAPSSATTSTSLPLNQEESEGNIPPQFLCAINKHIMKNPLSSPSGLNFECDTITLWLEQNGNFCPVTGKALCRSDLFPNKAIQQQITEWYIKRTIEKNLAEDGNFNEGELYEF